MFSISKIYENILGTLFAMYASRNEDILVDVQAHLKFLTCQVYKKILGTFSRSVAIRRTQTRFTAVSSDKNCADLHTLLTTMEISLKSRTEAETFSTMISTKTDSHLAAVESSVARINYRWTALAVSRTPDSRNKSVCDGVQYAFCMFST